MSGVNDDLRPWTQRQWSVAVVFIVLAQAGLLFVLQEREIRPRVSASSAGAEFRLVQWPGEFEEVTRQLGVSDPMLFAVPGPRSFSGEAWRLAQDYPPPSLGWGEGTRWLSGESNWFGRWSNAVQAGVMGLRPMRGRPVPAETRVVVSPLRVSRRSRMELDQGLQTRGLAVSPEIPAISHTNLLDATQLQVSVEPDGRVFSAVVLRSSGWEGADRQAWALVQRLQFAPTSTQVRPSADRQWGWVRFRWYTTRPVPPPSAGSAPSGA